MSTGRVARGVASGARDLVPRAADLSGIGDPSSGLGFTEAAECFEDGDAGEHRYLAAFVVLLSSDRSPSTVAKCRHCQVGRPQQR